ncbi:velvet factor-domain-containing protein [Ephemerocybe angulata]|uniref:Velvet factor-domain-containing protein n=1 Tax=Ephemerocybe angulata TaxID=980116 RepID=A0A8H6HNQ4_9AGAR|nr:velvet factor-domain-containing protein [Tulosesus angulatus]
MQNGLTRDAALADRRPIDPPPIVQLRVIDPSQGERRRRGSTNGSPPGSPTPSSSSRQQDDSDNSYAQSFLQNPYYFMFASLAKPDDDTELHWLKDGRTRCTTGSVVSSLYHLKDPQNNNEDAGFFVFPDLSVRTEGSYRLKLSLFEVVGNNVRHCKSIFSAPFYVYTAKKFPGMEESTPLSCSLADQGIKIRIRKDIRVRKRPNQGADFSVPLSMDDDEEDDHERSTRQLKRSRTDDGMGPGSSAMGAVPQTPQSQQPWPPVTIADPALGPPIPPPPGAATSTTLTTGADGPQQGTMTLGAPMAMGAYDSRGVYVYDQQQPQQPQPVPQQPPQQYRDPNQPQPQQAAAPPPPPQQHQPQQPYGMPHHAAPPPPPPQGYHYPQPAWGAPPQPQPVYDGGYYQQHAPPVQHPHYPPHPNAYAQPPPPPRLEGTSTPRRCTSSSRWRRCRRSMGTTSSRLFIISRCIPRPRLSRRQGHLRSSSNNSSSMVCLPRISSSRRRRRLSITRLYLRLYPLHLLSRRRARTRPLRSRRPSRSPNNNPNSNSNNNNPRPRRRATTTPTAPPQAHPNHVSTLRTHNTLNNRPHRPRPTAGTRPRPRRTRTRICSGRMRPSRRRPRRARMGMPMRRLRRRVCLRIGLGLGSSSSRGGGAIRMASSSSSSRWGLRPRSRFLRGCRCSRSNLSRVKDCSRCRDSKDRGSRGRGRDSSRFRRCSRRLCLRVGVVVVV